jgi:hypothetical protein
VTLDNLSRLGALLDAATDSGADDIPVGGQARAGAAQKRSAPAPPSDTR